MIIVWTVIVGDSCRGFVTLGWELCFELFALLARRRLLLSRFVTIHVRDRLLTNVFGFLECSLGHALDHFLTDAAFFLDSALEIALDCLFASFLAFPIRRLPQALNYFLADACTFLNPAVGRALLRVLADPFELLDESVECALC